MEPIVTDRDPFEVAVELQNSGRPAEAIAIYLQIMGDQPKVTLIRNLGACFHQLGRYDQAAYCLERATKARPGDPDLHLLLGHIQAARGQADAAEATYRNALALKPDHAAARLGLGNLHLSLGRYAEGWPLIDVRFDLNPDRAPTGPASYPQWRGESLAGKSILVLTEQGFGDHIQMCRFAQSLKARGASRVTLTCLWPLTPLLAMAPGVDAVTTYQPGQDLDLDRHDYWSHYFSLPELLGVTLETLPAAPYLAAPAERRARWAGYGGVGLCWRTSPSGFNAVNKNLPADEAERLLALGMISLHPEDTGARDFADTAAIIEQLDLVVSVDTAVAHLAGALGKPCWLLAPYLGLDWRWLRGRTDSPWYPSMKLYRLAAPGAWAAMVDAVSADLAVFHPG